MIKRLFDFFCSVMGAITLSPILLVVSILIKIDSGGPVVYLSTRIGKDKKPFKLYKFRTLVINADKIGGHSTSDDDLRMTKMGKFLRKYKLDELPQLLNVIKGEMSLVGPRPEVPEYAELYKNEELIVFKVKPGITDLASLWNSDEGAILKGSSDPEKTYLEKIRPEKVRLQIKYVKEKSFIRDLKIILKTLEKIRKP